MILYEYEYETIDLDTTCSASRAIQFNLYRTIINKASVFLSWQIQCVDKKYTSKIKYIHNMHTYTECIYINKCCCASFSIRLILPRSLSRAQLCISEIYVGWFDYRDINLMQTRGLGRQDEDIHHMVGSVISQLAPASWYSPIFSLYCFLSSFPLLSTFHLK